LLTGLKLKSSEGDISATTISGIFPLVDWVTEPDPLNELTERSLVNLRNSIALKGIIDFFIKELRTKEEILSRQISKANELFDLIDGCRDIEMKSKGLSILTKYSEPPKKTKSEVPEKPVKVSGAKRVTQKAIVKVLSSGLEMDHGSILANVHKITGKDYTNLSGHLSRLIQTGQVVRTDTGKYLLSPLNISPVKNVEPEGITKIAF
jgi:hypothetical protein